ncbi:hypothetical protein ACFQ88_04790 [Paenibacillus sp. NPDC056579]|uniref:hypothetical protein n=1 Tax=Paenibacillus sp. NPDC056579 TaxID=3345871 RepID=UPI003681A2D1
MRFLTVMGIIGMIVGLLQIITPVFFLKIRLQGINTKEQVKYGGVGTVIVGMIFIIFDLIT